MQSVLSRRYERNLWNRDETKNAKRTVSVILRQCTKQSLLSNETDIELNPNLTKPNKFFGTQSNSDQCNLTQLQPNVD